MILRFCDTLHLVPHMPSGWVLELPCNDLFPTEKLRDWNTVLLSFLYVDKPDTPKNVLGLGSVNSVVSGALFHGGVGSLYSQPAPWLGGAC